MASGVETIVLEVLPVFILAAAVGIFVTKVWELPYTIALLLAGLAVSVLGGVTNLLTIDIRLSHDVIFLVLLPPLLFEGAATTDFARLKRNVVPILALATVGLLVSIGVLGILGQYAFGFPLLVSLLFAAMVLPTDPVSVLALFDELGVPNRLSILVEGESLLNDGVGIVVFTGLLALVSNGSTAGDLFSVSGLGSLALEMVFVSVGGALVGYVCGYAVFRVMVNLDEHMTEVVLTLILTYGSFLLAEHYLHVSGVIATVVAGLFIGNRGTDEAMSPQTKSSIFSNLETIAFLVNTFIFVMIGVTTPIDHFAAHAALILLAIPLVLLARALAVYPITMLTNRLSMSAISTEYRHVIVWGGIHGSIPIALVLGLTLDKYPTLPVETLQAMVFGVAAFSLIVQGLSMSVLLDRLGVVTRSDAEVVYELLVGRMKAVDAAIDAVGRIHSWGTGPQSVEEAFTTEYGREKEQLRTTIATLLSEHPELGGEQRKVSERRVLHDEKSAVMDAIRTGVVTRDVGESLLEEIDLKLDLVETGQSTVMGDLEGYEEFWRERVRELGIPVDDTDDKPDEADTEDASG